MISLFRCNYSKITNFDCFTVVSVSKFYDPSDFMANKITIFTVSTQIKILAANILAVDCILAVSVHEQCLVPVNWLLISVVFYYVGGHCACSCCRCKRRYIFLPHFERMFYWWLSSYMRFYCPIFNTWTRARTSGVEFSSILNRPRFACAPIKSA